MRHLLYGSGDLSSQKISRRYTKDFSKLPLGGDLLELSFGASRLRSKGSAIVCSDCPERGHSSAIFEDGLFFAPTDAEKWEIPHRILKNPFSVRGRLGMQCAQELDVRSQYGEQESAPSCR